MLTKIMFALLFVIFFTLLSEKNILDCVMRSINKEHNYVEIISNKNIFWGDYKTDVLTVEEMSNIYGGCSGGTCSDYPHSCPSNCTHYNADQCKGTIGNCVNDILAMICACPSYYDFISGCP